MIGMIEKQSNSGFEVIENSVGEDGVDISLIRWMLSLTPDERLQVLSDFANDIMELRDGRKKD